MVVAALATALGGSVAGLPSATAAAGNAPVVTFTTPSVTGFTVTLSYSINRDPQQIAKVTCTLTSAASATGASCGSRAGSTKKSTTYQVTLTNLDAARWNYTVSASTTDGKKGSAATGFTVNPVSAHCTVTGYSVAYDAHAHIATGSCAGIGGSVLPAADLHLAGTSHTGAGGYSDTWSFTDPAGNYTNPGGSVTDTITPATAACAVSAYSLTYDATPHIATGSCTDVDGTVLPAADLDLAGTSHTGAGSYSDTWSFTDPTGNYTNPGGTLTDAITHAAANCTVTGYSLTYDATPHTATGSCTGVDGTTLPAADLDLSGTGHTGAGAHTDAWSFTDPDGNYASPGGTLTDTISPATTDCTVTGYNLASDSTAHTATGSCTGIGGVDLSSDLDLNGTTHTEIGEYTDSWTFTDPDGNYANPGGTVTDTITPSGTTVDFTKPGTYYLTVPAGETITLNLAGAGGGGGGTNTSVQARPVSAGDGGTGSAVTVTVTNTRADATTFTLWVAAGGGAGDAGVVPGVGGDGFGRGGQGGSSFGGAAGGGGGGSTALVDSDGNVIVEAGGGGGGGGEAAHLRAVATFGTGGQGATQDSGDTASTATGDTASSGTNGNFGCVGGDGLGCGGSGGATYIGSVSVADGGAITNTPGLLDGGIDGWYGRGGWGGNGRDETGLFVGNCGGGGAGAAGGGAGTMTEVISNAGWGGGGGAGSNYTNGTPTFPTTIGAATLPSNGGAGTTGNGLTRGTDGGSGSAMVTTTNSGGFTWHN
ncbi:hypothetical protein ACVW00_000514 [Marmoricola sp. URHA0025 HA25]